MNLLRLLFACIVGSLAVEAGMPRLKVSEDQRFLVTSEGRPFFWLGDTAWELFHRLNRADAVHYLNDRAGKGFTVIQAVAIAELDGHSTPNANGHLPLSHLDPASPAIQEGANNDYWDHVDFIVEEANKRGLYIGFLPTWGRFWRDKSETRTPFFNAANAEIYGEWLGKRYKDAGLVWILGGDRDVVTEEHKGILRAMARGLQKGDEGAHLITFHPPGGAGSSKWFHEEAWLSFNMRQNGHTAEFTGRYDQTRADYDLKPTKPVIDGEPIYEDHPVSFNPKNFGHSIAGDVRRPLYWDLFSGACGHTYGHHSVWQMWSEDKPPINSPLMNWREALQQPGAAQMQFGKRLIESRPIPGRIPDDSVLVPDRVPTSMPGAGRYHFCATRDVNSTFAMIYAPVGRSFKVRMNVIRGPRVKGWWYDPRNGEAHPIGSFDNKGEAVFTPPNPGEMLDWVLVLDDAAKQYPPPGGRNVN